MTECKHGKGIEWCPKCLADDMYRVTSATDPTPELIEFEDPCQHGWERSDCVRCSPPQRGTYNGFYPPQPADAEIPPRRIELTAAAQIQPRRVKWAWEGRVALGTLALLAGPEGLGKSTLAYWIAARITRGELPGENLGSPRTVLVCATEDSWEHTIVPRLMAAGADRSLVYRIEVKDADDITLGLSLPRDLHDLKEAAQQTDAALLILDPLMSRLSEELDTHKDGEVRRALEPMVGIADATRMAIVGLIHHNKSGSSDPLSLVMASKAFTAVARSVHTVIKDPDDETEQRRLFGTPKNNLGRTDLPVMSFTITRWEYDTDDGPSDTGQLVWGEDIDGTIGDAIRRAGEDPNNRTAAAECAEWLDDYMSAHGPKIASSDVKSAARKAGHSDHALHAARRRLRLQVVNEGFPRVSYWVRLFASPSASSHVNPPGETHHLIRLETTGQSRTNIGDDPSGSAEIDGNAGNGQSSPVVSSCEVPRAREPQLNCPECGFSFDSQGHEINCGGRK